MRTTRWALLIAALSIGLLAACEATTPVPDSEPEDARTLQVASHVLLKSDAIEARNGGSDVDGRSIPLDSGKDFATVRVVRDGHLPSGSVWTIAVQKWVQVSPTFGAWSDAWNIGFVYGNNGGFLHCTHDHPNGGCEVRRGFDGFNHDKLGVGRYRVRILIPHRLIADFTVVGNHPEPEDEPRALLTGQRSGDDVRVELADDSPAGEYTIGVGFSFNWRRHHPGMSRHVVSFAFDPEGAPRYSWDEDGTGCPGTVATGDGVCEIEIPSTRTDELAKRVRFEIVKPAADHPEWQWLCFGSGRPAHAYCTE